MKVVVGLVMMMLAGFALAEPPEPCKISKENATKRKMEYCLWSHIQYYADKDHYDFAKAEAAIFQMQELDILKKDTIRSFVNRVRTSLYDITEYQPDQVINTADQIRDVLFGLCGECLGVHSPQFFIDIDRLTEEAKLYKARNERWKVTDDLVSEFWANDDLVDQATDPELVKALAYAQFDLYMKVREKTQDRAEEKLQRDAAKAVQRAEALFQRSRKCSDYDSYAQIKQLRELIFGRKIRGIHQRYFCS